MIWFLGSAFIAQLILLLMIYREIRYISTTLTSAAIDAKFIGIAVSKWSKDEPGSIL